MKKIDFRLLNLLSISWIAVGVIIFLFGWCRWYYAIPVVLLIVLMLYGIYKTDNSDKLVISHKIFWMAFGIAFLMMALSGIGGYVVQSNDNYWRNAMFRDLVNYAWPVYDVQTGLTKSYYIAFWMVPAIVSKMLNSMEAGFFTQLLWLSIGTQLLFLQVCRYMGKARVSYLFFFYFFSGLKIIECLLYYPVFGDGSLLGPMIENISKNETPGSFHAGPMVQFLYDPFNQTIPLFLGMMFMINNVKSKYIPYVFSLLLLYAPLPLVGLAPMVLYWFVKNVFCQESKSRIIYVFSLENITALLILILSAFYLMSNNNSGHKGLRPISDLGADIYAYIIYMIFEFGIMMAIGYKAAKDKVVLWIAFVSVAVFGWFQIGLHNDFCFRTNMPLIFMLYLLVTKRYYMAETSKLLRYIIIAWYLLAGIPAQMHPLSRWVSSYFIIKGESQSVLNNYQHLVDVNSLYVMQQKKLRNDDLPSSFRCRKDQYQFRTDVGTPDSFFFKFIARK